MPHPTWPLFDLRLTAGDLELRLPTDGELDTLCALARAGIHAPDAMPFAVPWSVRPSPAFERGFVQYHWRQRASWSPDAWSLELGVWRGGVLVGAQGVGATDFAVMRTVATGSWLGREHQGRGTGRRMRELVLAFAFDHLGAEVATTSAYLDNAASAGVSRALGYREDGLGRFAPQGVARDTQRFRMTREDWRGRPRGEVRVEGLERCRDGFGAT